eukprot:9045856-Alexandrium_andersonii.AAC.1
MANGAARLSPTASVVAPAMQPPWLLSSDVLARGASRKVAHRRRPGGTCVKIRPKSGSFLRSATHTHTL